MSQIPAGWYPNAQGEMQWWDGNAWSVPSPPKRNKTLTIWLSVIVTLVLATLAFLMFKVGSTMYEGARQAQTPTALSECREAARTISNAIDEHYKSHPFHTTDAPAFDASPEDQAAFDALAADEEAQYNATVAPIYEACKSPADWFDAAKMYPTIAVATEAEFVNSGSLEWWCGQSPESPACTNIDEWLATNPDGMN